MEFSRQGYQSGLPFSRGCSPPRDWTWISCIAGRFFTIWATKEDKLFGNHLQKDNVLSPMNTWVSYPVTFELSFELIYLILAKRSFYLEVKKIVLPTNRLFNQQSKCNEVVLCVRLCPKCWGCGCEKRFQPQGVYSLKEEIWSKQKNRNEQGNFRRWSMILRWLKRVMNRQ